MAGERCIHCGDAGTCSLCYVERLKSALSAAREENESLRAALGRFPLNCIWVGNAEASDCLAVKRSPCRGCRVRAALSGRGDG